jgi:hypothetical protein
MVGTQRCLPTTCRHDEWGVFYVFFEFRQPHEGKERNFQIHLDINLVRWASPTNLMPLPYENDVPPKRRYKEE